jgi:hypothetical protein
MRALVIGGGASVWADVRETEHMFGPDWWDLVVAANDVGCHWPRHLDAWATLHVEKMAKWRTERDEAGHPTGYVTYARAGKKRKGIDQTIPYPFGGGASGLLAVSVALHLGATRIVLCGVPMTRTPHFAESNVHLPSKPWSTPDSHWKKWVRSAPTLAPVIRSMGGRTAEKFGAPTAEWLGLHASVGG